MNGKQDLYFAMPEYDSTPHSKTYVGGNIGIQSGENEDENLYHISPGIHKAHAYKFFDLAYGMYGYAGGYEVQAIREETGIKEFYGIGARGAANFNMRYDNFELRVLGIKAAISKEFGGYRQFREAYQTPKVDTLWMHNSNGYSLNLAASSALVFKSNNGYFALDSSMGWSKNWKKPKYNGYYFQSGLIKKWKAYTGFIHLNASGFANLSLGINLGLQMPLNQF